MRRSLLFVARSVLSRCLLPSLILTLTVPLLWQDLAVQAQDAIFTVTVDQKTPRHPYFNHGEPVGYVVNDVNGAELTLIRGRTYEFQMDNVPPDHPFYISTSESGVGAGVYSDGVDGNFATGNQTLTFTVPMDAPDVLFYQCQAHLHMGAKLNIIGHVLEVGLEPIAQGFTAPLAVVEPPDGSGRLFIIDQAGVIRIFQNGALEAEPFLDVRDRMVSLRASFDERGLLGLAFHPDYAQNGRFFVYYSAPLRDGGPAEWDHTSHISEFLVSDDDPNLADHDSERIILQVDQPQFNHNGGTVIFGPEDGYLYISLGDGGGSDDTGLGHVDDWYDVNEGGNAQAYRENVLGTILRIDVDNGDPYAVPPDNPFVGIEGIDEIYAFGLRNPYRVSFDMGGTHAFFAGDAGQLRWEGAYLIEAGGNYGWNVKEGRHCFNTDDSTVDRQQCPDEDPEGRPLRDPVIEYANNRQPGGLGAVIIGGNVYRGENLPDFQGRYVFGEWSATGDPDGVIFIETNRREPGTWDFERLEIVNGTDGHLGHYLLGFGQDLSGEMYVLTTDMRGPEGQTGRVYKMVHPTDVSTDPITEVPTSIALHQNYPNPFNPSTTIRFDLTEPAATTLRIYDLLGREVATIVNEHLQAGTHSFTWEGADNAGREVASGVYVYRLSSGGITESRLMTFAK